MISTVWHAGLSCSRAEPVDACRAHAASPTPLADLAALIHRLCPEVRLM